MKKVTMADIAKKANVTTITVSRALSTPDKVKAETRDKIEKLAKEMGYIPNILAKGLKSGSKTIGVIVPSINNPFFAKTIQLISRYSAEKGYNCFFFTSDESSEIEEDCVNTLISYAVEGIIISVISEDENYQPDYFERLKYIGIPVVLLDRYVSKPHDCGVYLDNMDSGYKLAREVVKDGNKDILIVAGSPQSKVSNDRLDGMKRALDWLSGEVEVEIINADFNKKLAREKVQEYLKIAKPDAIVGLNNQITLGCLEASHLSGYKSSEDIHFYSIDKVAGSESFGIHIPCIEHNIDELAVQSVNQLLRVINSKTGSTLGDIVIRGRVSAKQIDD
ncbi:MULTISPECIES: LacI family DNA-binding transcriptional regulator [Vibrio]|uniref:LacI family DNA-binding transcriptional regulator n=1 Tax=Vibrio TaxID=662 RepID=UPI0004DD0371|nr:MULTISPECIES: LacI family DNA-binding transcriptional regulator [Vibrio]KFA99333.1 LacI family transcriptional regulator [Vibrio sp. ER1A]MCG9661133.1 LacI family transcriptional regulator [Vibrio mediterranei]